VDEYSGELSFYLGVFHVYNFSHVCLLLQCSQYKLLKKGKKSSLTEERVSLLEEIGFIPRFVMPHLQTHASQKQRSASSSSNTNRQGPVRNPYISSNTNQQGPASTVPVTEEDWKEWEEEEEEEEKELLQEGYLLEMEEQSARRSGATPQRGLISLQAIRATRALRGVTPSPQSDLRRPRSFLQQPLSWGSFEEDVTYSVSDVNMILTSLRNNNIEHYNQSFDKAITVSCRTSYQTGSFNIVRNGGGRGKKKHMFLAVLEFFDAKEGSNDKLACQIDSSIVDSYFSPLTAVSSMYILYFIHILLQISRSYFSFYPHRLISVR